MTEGFTKTANLGNSVAQGLSVRTAGQTGKMSAASGVQSSSFALLGELVEDDDMTDKIDLLKEKVQSPYSA